MTARDRLHLQSKVKVFSRSSHQHAEDRDGLRATNTP